MFIKSVDTIMTSWHHIIANTIELKGMPLQSAINKSHCKVFTML